MNYLFQRTPPMFFQTFLGGKEDGDIRSDYQYQWNHKECKCVEDGHIFPGGVHFQQCVKNGKQPRQHNTSKDIDCREKKVQTREEN